MEKIVIVGCGAYMDSGYGCPGEWRCLKAAALGEGHFDEPTQVITVRLPKSLHEALRVEADEHHTSMNKLCISKLLQFIDHERVPGHV